MKIYFDGKIIEEKDFKISLDNRAFNYGDGIFETIKIYKKKPLFFNLHFSRMIIALDLLQFIIPEEWSVHFFERIIEDLLFENRIENGTLKIQFVRKPGGKYNPESNAADLLIYFRSTEGEAYSLKNEEYKICIFDKLPKQISNFSQFKSINSQTYVQAAIEAEKRNLNNVLVVNDQGRIADASNSNVVLRINNLLIAPPLSEGGVDGVMRRVLKKMFKQNKLELIEAPISLTDVNSADEIFLTNVSRGIMPVTHLEDKKLEIKSAKVAFDLLEKKVDSIFV